jgi:hypothetical protein
MQTERSSKARKPIRRIGPLVVVIAAVGGIVAMIVAIANSHAASEKLPAADQRPPGAREQTSDAASALGSADAPPPAPPGEHPIDASLAIAHKVQEHLQRDVKDYTCTFVKSERVNGELLGPQQVAAKVRQKPFGVYFKFLKPADVKGREVIYYPEQNNGKLVAREGSGLKRLLGAVFLEPTSPLAMAGQKYPITDVGISFLVKRLIEVAEADRKYGEVEVKFFKNAKVNDRNCMVIQVTHPTPRRVFLFHLARVYIDDELQLPIHYEAYLWPEKPGDPPPLDESYSYLNLKLNVGLTDADFDYKNPKYGFVDK